MHQMGLAQADAAVQEQRIEAGAGRTFRDAPRAGVGELVRFADDKTLEGEARIERRGEIRTRFDTIVLPSRSGGPRRHTRGGSTRGGRRPRRAVRFAGERYAFGQRPPAADALRRRGYRPAAPPDFPPATARAAGRRNGLRPSRAETASAD